MHVLAVRVMGNVEEAARAAATAFVEAWAGARYRLAARQVPSGLGWFGRRMTAEQWVAHMERAQGRTVLPLRFVGVLGPGMSVLGARAEVVRALGGPLGPEDRLFLFDLTRGRRTATAGVVVHSAPTSAQVLRVIDPTEIKRLVDTTAA